MLKQMICHFNFFLIYFVIFGVFLTEPILGNALNTDSNASEYSEENRDNRYLIRYENVSIIEYIKFISRISNKNFHFEEGDLQFNVTVFSEEPTTVEDILATLMQILRVHGLYLLEQGNNLVIHKSDEVKQISKIVSDDFKHVSTEASELITRVFRLKNVNPQRLSEIIRPMTSKGALVEISTETRHLIVTDIQANIEKISQLLKSLDTPNTSLDIGVYSARNAFLDSLVTLTNQIMQPLKDGNPFILVPHSSSESIFIVSTPYLIDKSITVMKALDIVSPQNEPIHLPEGHIENTGFYIHKLQYHKGKDIEDSLKSIGKNLAESKMGNQQLVSAIGTMRWIQSTNSLLFSGDAAALQKVKDLISNLDTPPKQVFIEVLVIDTSIEDSLNFGVDWGMQMTPGDGGSLEKTVGSGFLSKNNAFNGVFNTAPSSLRGDNLMQSKGFNFNIVGRFLKRTNASGNEIFSSLGALVHALSADKKTNILLSPRIIAQDHTAANIFVGDEVRLEKASTLREGENTPITNRQFEYREIGAKLSVLPILGNDDMVTLEINQEVSTVSDAAITSGGDSGPKSFFKSSTQTTVHVPDKHFLVLSGMIREQKSKGHVQVPCLGAIPFLGGAFKKSEDLNSKRNTMIFIRPHIIRNSREAIALTKEQEQLYREKSEHSHILDDLDFTLRHLNLRNYKQGPLFINQAPDGESAEINLKKDKHPLLNSSSLGLDYLDLKSSPQR